MKKAELASHIKEIRPGTPLHELIIRNFKQRLRASKDTKRSKRVQAWEDAENTFTAYMPETEVDSIRKQKRNQGLTDYTTIQVPYSYAMLLTAHTYYTSVFLGRDPIMQVRGRHGESQQAESTVEALLDYQLQSGYNIPPIIFWLMDVGKYGQGVIGHYWDRESNVVKQYKDVPRTFLGVEIPGAMERKLVETEVLGYEGNKLYNVRPHDFYSDPGVPLWRFQEGEFCIVYDRVGWVKIADRAARGLYFNVEALKRTQEQRPRELEGTGHDTELPGENVDYYNTDSSYPTACDLHEFHWDLVPSEVKLGGGSRPEKWVFTIANEELVIGAQPLGAMHDQYPFDVIVFETEAYNVYNRSMLEILSPLNDTMSWLFNSHFFNVRASLNNMFVADPSRVNIRDFEEPGPGKMIRLKPAGYGTAIDQIVRQYPVQDVTRGNLADTEAVGLLAQRVMGVSDNIMGAVNAGGRKTATEVRSSTTFGINRLKTNCELFSAVGFAPLVIKLIANTQQLMSQERQFRVVGDQAQWGERYLMATPDMIAGCYDFVPVDGTLPVDRFAQVNLWQILLSNMARVPGALMQYDISKIFAFIAQLGGIKNIGRFRIEVTPDAAVQNAAAAGNVVPMKGNVQEPGQIPGMGSTG